MRLYSLLFIFLAFNACIGRFDLKSQTLPTALLEESYDYDFEVDYENWTTFFEDDMVVRLDEGGLPDGMGLTSDGAVIGTPIEVGEFNFRIVVYEADEDVGAETTYADAEWFFIFVTEMSTNDDCPRPDDTETSEIYLCAGEVEEDEGLAEGETFSLDLNWHFNLEDARDAEIRTLSFTVSYDPALFSIDDGNLDEGMLREASTRTKPEAVFVSDVPGELSVTLTATTKDFSRSGRLADIPFTALTDVPDGSYDFEVAMDEIVTKDDSVVLPDIEIVNGSLDVTGSEE